MNGLQVDLDCPSCISMLRHALWNVWKSWNMLKFVLPTLSASWTQNEAVNQKGSNVIRVTLEDGSDPNSENSQTIEIQEIPSVEDKEMFG